MIFISGEVEPRILSASANLTSETSYVVTWQIDRPDSVMFMEVSPETFSPFENDSQRRYTGNEVSLLYMLPGAVFNIRLTPFNNFYGDSVMLEAVVPVGHVDINADDFSYDSISGSLETESMFEKMILTLLDAHFGEKMDEFEFSANVDDTGLSWSFYALTPGTRYNLTVDVWPNSNPKFVKTFTESVHTSCSELILRNKVVNIDGSLRMTFGTRGNGDFIDYEITNFNLEVVEKHRKMFQRELVLTFPSDYDGYLLTGKVIGVEDSPSAIFSISYVAIIQAVEFHPIDFGYGVLIIPFYIGIMEILSVHDDSSASPPIECYMNSPCEVNNLISGQWIDFKLQPYFGAYVGPLFSQGYLVPESNLMIGTPDIMKSEFSPWYRQYIDIEFTVVGYVDTFEVTLDHQIPTGSYGLCLYLCFFSQHLQKILAFLKFIYQLFIKLYNF